VDPHAVLQPVGSRPPHVYWVRRLVLLVGVTVLVVLASHACAGGGSPSGNAQLRQRADQQPLVSSSPTPSASTVAAAPVTSCRARDLTVAVTADATNYALGVDPRFTAVVRNSGPACRFPTALSTRSWRILSGADEVWSTGDCPRSAGGKPVRLAARAQITYVLPWDRFRSTPGCAVAGAPAQAGTYRLYVTIAGASAPAVVFHLAD
jgi:hypothetical protein